MEQTKKNEYYVINIITNFYNINKIMNYTY